MDSTFSTPLSSNDSSKFSRDNEFNNWLPEEPGDLCTLLFLDGEIPQVKYLASENSIVNQISNFVVIKLSAACSSRQQPNDCMRSFAIIRRMLNSASYNFDIKSCKCKEPLIVGFQNKVSRLLNSMTKESKKTYRKFFNSITSILNVAYSNNIISKGWELTGLEFKTFDPKSVLSNCTSWGQLALENQDKIAEAIKKLRLDAIENIPTGHIATISDDLLTKTFESILGSIDEFNVAPQKRKPVHELSFSRWRASIISSNISDFLSLSIPIPTEVAPTTTGATNDVVEPELAPNRKGWLAVKCGLYNCPNYYWRKPNQRGHAEGFSSCTCCKRSPLVVCSAQNCLLRLLEHKLLMVDSKLPTLYKPSTR